MHVLILVSHLAALMLNHSEEHTYGTLDKEGNLKSFFSTKEGGNGTLIYILGYETYS